MSYSLWLVLQENHETFIPPGKSSFVQEEKDYIKSWANLDLCAHHWTFQPLLWPMDFASFVNLR